MQSEVAALESQWPGYVKTIRELAARRALVRAAQDVRQAAMDLTSPVGGQPQAAAGRFAQMGCGQQPLSTMEADNAEMFDDLIAARSGARPVCFRTGIDVWDCVLGGLVPGVLTFVGAQPGVGKSALLGRMVINLAQAGTRVGLISLEDAPKWLSRRALAEATRIPVRVLATEPLTAHQFASAEAAISDAFIWHRNIVRQPPERLTSANVSQVARSMILNHGAKAIFLDHLGEIDVRSGRRDRHDLDVNEAVAALRDVAVDHNAPVVVAAHFHRPRTSDTEPRYQRPTSTSWGESAYIERKARVAVGLWLQKSMRERVVCTVLKQTLGASDIDFWMPFNPLSSLVGSEGGCVEQDEEGRERLGFTEEADS